MYSFRMRSSLNVRTRYIVALYIRDFYNNYTRMEICIRSTFFRREHYKYYTNISLILYQNKYLSLVHGCCNTRHERIMALRRAEMADREEAEIGGRLYSQRYNVFRSRTELRLKNEERNFEFNAGGEGKPMKLLCHKR